MPNLDKDFYLDKQGLRQLINELETNIVALEYDTTVSYTVGQYCVYENNFYRCTTATTGAWDSTAWVKIVISDEIPVIHSITTAQWEALTPAQKASGDYVITDATTVPLTAENVPYDDTVSGLTADNVQDAIDELASGGGSGSGICNVIGTQTEMTSAWTGELHGVSALYDGLIINYYLPYNSLTGTYVTLNLTLDSGTTTGAVNCYYGNTTRLATQYSNGSNIIMTYWSAGSISINGTATTDNRWIANADYNTTIPNTDYRVRQSLTSANNNRPLLMSALTNTSSTSYTDSTSYRNNNIYANPSTGNIHTITLNGYIPTGAWVGTQAQYDAIATPDPNTTYYITDGYAPPTPNAGTIGYDNTGSGLSANTVQAAIDEVINRIYPVGSIYMSVTDSTVEAVQAKFGGTWVRFGAGRTLVGYDSTQTEFDTVEDTGGSKTHTHSYGIRLGGWYSSTAMEGNTNVGAKNYSDATNYTMSNLVRSGTDADTVINNGAEQTTKTSSCAKYDMDGNASYTSTLQPYITVYMYKRTA